MQPNKKFQFEKEQSKSTVLEKVILKSDAQQSCKKEILQDIPVYTPYQLYSTQKNYIAYVLKCINDKKTGVIQSPTGTGKTMSLIGSTLAWQYNQSKNYIHTKQPNLPQIIFTSRTHAQLKQAISELKKFPYQIKSCILSSRDQSCINPELKQLKGKDLGFQCRKRIMHQEGKSCSFYKSQKVYEELKWNGKILDLEEVIFRGKCQGFCPYYYGKGLKSSAHVVFMPYNYLFEQYNKLEENGVQLRNSILIIDQAHNIQQTLQRSKQFTLTLNTLTRALNQISQLHEQKLQQQKNSPKNINPTDDDFLPQKRKKKINSSLKSIQYHASYITLLHFYFQTLDIPMGNEGRLFTMGEFLEVIQNGTKDSEFGIITQKIKEIVAEIKELRADLMLRPFWALQSWAMFIDKIFQMYTIHSKDSSSSKYKVQFLYEGSIIKLNIYCLDPSSAFSQILKYQPRSVILTSGTLSPIKSFIMQLKIPKIQPVSCSHIIDPGQAKTYIVTRGPNIKLNFSYENRNNQRIYQQLGLVLAQIIKHTPNGVVVFFPSYQLLEEAKNGLSSSKLLSKIYEYKSLYVEKKDNIEFKEVLQGYLRDAQKPRGAVLFALIRGKISQGLDFADEKCRAVVVVGVPYPARRDIKVISKMQYLNQLCNQNPNQNLMTGEQWYLSEAIRSINQGIGRIIRHRKDHGKIYLLDERYQRNKPDLKGQLSSWARASLTVITNYYDLADEFKRSKQQSLNFLNRSSLSQNEALLDIGGFRSISGEVKKLKDQKVGQIKQDYQKEKKVKIVSLKQMLEQMKNQKPSQENQQKKQQKMEIKLQKQQTLSETTSKFQSPKEQNKPISKEKQIFCKKNSDFKVNFQKDKKYTPIDVKEQCPVCRLQKKLIKNCVCTHSICIDCWKEWLKKDLRCPICRIRVREKFLILEN